LHGSDTELAQAAARGDAQAFHELVERHSSAMFRLALSLSGRRADAEDICQEAFIGAFRGVRRFDGRASFKTWLTRILLRQAAKVWKKNQSRSMLSIDAAMDSEKSGLNGSRRSFEPSGPAVDLDTAMDRVEMVARLGPDHQQVVVLREMHGMSYEEIANLLGIPRGTVESRLYRARAELRKLLKDYEL
jgi:RNA polymerase sigma-70 factor (ECF subfamily)